MRVLDRRMSEYRCENQRLADELTNVKKKYLSQKKLQRWCWSLCDIISAGKEDCCVHPVCHQPKQVQYQATDGPAGSSAPPQQQVQLYWRRLQGWESYEEMTNSTDLMSWLLVFFSHDFDPGLNNKDWFLLSIIIWVVFFRPLASEELCMDWMLLKWSSIKW